MTPLRARHSARPPVGTRLERDLTAALSRLRQCGGPVAPEDLPGAIGSNSPFADLLDDSQANASREIGLATRALLAERVACLAAALERLSDGQYGVCAECGQPIPPARLQALPEVPTCVGCQDGLERLGRRADRLRRSAFAVGEDPLTSGASHASVRASYFPNEEDRQAMR